MERNNHGVNPNETKSSWGNLLPQPVDFAESVAFSTLLFKPTHEVVVFLYSHSPQFAHMVNVIDKLTSGK